MSSIDQNQLSRELFDYAHEMKRDWDERARQNARWFINSGRHRQSAQIMPSEEELCAQGRDDSKHLLLDHLPLLLPGSDLKSLRIFEIGCGIGRMTQTLAENFSEVYATDISSEMLKLAHERLHNHKNVRLFETNGLNFADLPDNFFDVVFSAYVFQHVPDLAVTLSLINDAFRVLKPGGVMKFNVNSFATMGFEEIAHDTWVGAPFPESDLRGWVREKNAQLTCIQDAGTVECWVTLRKPATDEISSVIGKSTILIEDFGRTDDFKIKEIPIKGRDAQIALIVSGLSTDIYDCNNIAIEINSEEVLPCYVGPVKPHIATALSNQLQNTLENLTLVEVRIPVGEMDELVAVRVKLNDQETSQPVTIALKTLQPTVPQIDRVVNRADEGPDVYTRGPKSALRLYVAGLDLTADTGNIRVQVGHQIIKPGFVYQVPREGYYCIDVQLPEEVKPGATEVRLYFGNLESPSHSVIIESGH